MHGRRINTEVLERQGAGFVGKHAPDLAIFADPFFRGIDVRFGPDQQLYVIDWSDTGECHESTGVHRTSGRIYKISATSSVTDNAPKPIASTKPALPLPLDIETSELLRLLTHQDEYVRVAAVRRLSDAWPIDTLIGLHPQAVSSVDATVLNALLTTAKNDPSGLVQLALASVLQRLPIRDRLQLATQLVQKTELGADRDYPLMIWFGLLSLGKQQPEALVELAQVNQLPLVERYIARMLAGNFERQPEMLNTLVGKLATLPESMQAEVLTVWLKLIKACAESRHRATGLLTLPPLGRAVY